MNRKEYELIAEVLRNNTKGANNSEFSKGWIASNTDIIYDLCNEFELTYPNFDRNKFLKACGL